MTTRVKRICAAAGVSLAALVATGAASSARAEDQPVHIQVSDLNLSTPQGRAAFEFRLSQAATQMCEDRGDLHSTMQCQRAVREEAMDHLDELARRDGVSLPAARR